LFCGIKEIIVFYFGHVFYNLPTTLPHIILLLLSTCVHVCAHSHAQSGKEGKVGIISSFTSEATEDRGRMANDLPESHTVEDMEKTDGSFRFSFSHTPITILGRVEL
jgi:hypothetical protein